MHMKGMRSMKPRMGKMKPNPKRAMKMAAMRGTGSPAKKFSHSLNTMSRDEKISTMEDMMGDEKF